MMCWKRLVVCAGLVMMAALQTYAQTDQYVFRIGLANKTGTANLSQPLTFLSQRAIDRRAAQGIAIDSTDLPVAPRYIDSILANTPTGKLHITSRWLNQVVVLVTDSADIINLQGKPYITGIDYIGFYTGGLHRGAAAQGGKEGLEQEMTLRTAGSQAYYGATFDQTRLVNGDHLHDIGHTGRGKLIAVLDAGFREVEDHPGFDSMVAQGRLIDRHDFIRDTSYVYEHSFHGTSALSAMAGLWPGQYVGSAPHATYAIYITEKEGSEQPVELDQMIAGIERADSLGADIVTASLGYNTFDFPFADFNFSQFDGKTTQVAQAANMATKKGMLFCVSAGNEGNTPWQRILTPADADSALTVGAVDIGGQPASFSSYGPNANGVVKPDICVSGAPAVVLNYGGSISGIGGTSFALPQAVGFAACLWEAQPTATPYMLRRAIVQSASHYTNPGPQLGYGIPNFKSAAFLLGITDTPIIPLPPAEGFLTAYPNPTRGDVQLLINHIGTGSIGITVFDISGRLLITTTRAATNGLSHHTISLPTALPAGLYFLRAATASQSATVKLVKN